jgi:hypothetical protein
MQLIVFLATCSKLIDEAVVEEIHFQQRGGELEITLRGWMFILGSLLVPIIKRSIGCYTNI